MLSVLSFLWNHSKCHLATFIRWSTNHKLYLKLSLNPSFSLEIRRKEIKIISLREGIALFDMRRLSEIIFIFIIPLNKTI